MEHIVPVSLGNSNHVLPAGIVCDKCNNYFARKVEGPFLNCPTIRTLRARQRVPNRRGLLPFGEGVIVELGLPVDINFWSKKGLELIPRTKAVASELRKFFESARDGTLVVPHGFHSEKKILSRFLVKMSFEALALRLRNCSGFQEFLSSDRQFDDIRKYARFGSNVDIWPFFQRRIYNEDQLFEDRHENRAHQIMHEFDFLYTANCEAYFVIAIFGMEFAVNIGGPDIAGYVSWLEQNEYVSLLYSGRNADLGQKAAGT